jgi:uncharacterized protein (DUF433 family)
MLSGFVGHECKDGGAMTEVSVLDREMFSEAEAARLLGVPQGTLHYWLDGKGKGRKAYRPVIRDEPRGWAAPVTWAEFVEAGLLREYRRTIKVELDELRSFITDLRERLGIPYPLADQRPYTSGRSIVWTAQERAGLDPSLYLVTFVGDQYLLTPASESFLRRVRWEGNLATGWRPVADEESPVLIDPRLRSGRPAVNGISTEIIWEHHDAGEDDQEIADAFGLSTSDIAWALAYEKPRRAAA